MLTGTNAAVPNRKLPTVAARARTLHRQSSAPNATTLVGGGRSGSDFLRLSMARSENTNLFVISFLVELATVGLMNESVGGGPKRNAALNKGISVAWLTSLRADVAAHTVIKFVALWPSMSVCENYAYLYP